MASHLAASPSSSLATTFRIQDCSPDVSGSSKFHRLCKVLVVKLQTRSFLVAVLVFPLGRMFWLWLHKDSVSRSLRGSFSAGFPSCRDPSSSDAGFFMETSGTLMLSFRPTDLFDFLWSNYSFQIQAFHDYWSVLLLLFLQNKHMNDNADIAEKLRNNNDLPNLNFSWFLSLNKVSQSLTDTRKLWKQIFRHVKKWSQRTQSSDDSDHVN